MTALAIHQPHYLPWLGYLAKWAAADVFVFLDTVQYVRNGWQNRNRIKTAAGPRWLTVPVHARLGTPLAEVASPRNTLVGHGTAILAGALSLAVFGLLDAPSAFVDDGFELRASIEQQAT